MGVNGLARRGWCLMGDFPCLSGWGRVQVQQFLVLYLDAYVREVRDFVAHPLYGNGTRPNYCIHGDQVRGRASPRLLLASSFRARGSSLAFRRRGVKCFF